LRYRHALTAIATVLACALSTSAAPAATQPATQRADADNGSIAHSIAAAYGIDGWDKIKRLDFTFNVDTPNRDEPMSRQWTWWPKQGKIKLHDGYRDGRDVQLPLTPGTTNLLADARYTERATKVHKQFINDTYWLLFPFHVVWSNPEIRSRDLGKVGGIRKVTVQYPDEGGYTPGDAYDLYLDPQTQRIEQWVFRRDGKENGSAMTWGKHRKLGPIVVSLEHWGADKKFHLWFSDVRAELVGEDEAVTPQPMEP